MVVLFNNFILLNNVNLTENINPLNSFLITTILMLFIVISLYLTFYQKGNAVHKVLGLLLSSIFIVFLWIMQTQFLFIYLVYILAFISAVLMLFLSVVLMLPISTLNNINKNNIYPIFFNIEFLEYFTVEILILLILVYNILYVINANYFYLISQKIKNVVSSDFTNEYLINFINFYKINNQFLLKILSIGIKSIQISYIFINIIISSIFYYFYYFSFAVFNSLTINKQKLIDIVTQLYLFINMFLVIIITQVSVNNLKIDIVHDEKVLGLGILKDLLYNQYPAFLIVSTIVLLVALIGAAIMTKKIK